MSGRAIWDPPVLKLKLEKVVYNQELKVENILPDELRLFDKDKATPAAFKNGSYIQFGDSYYVLEITGSSQGEFVRTHR